MNLTFSAPEVIKLVAHHVLARHLLLLWWSPNIFEMPSRAPYWSYRNSIFSVKNQGAFTLDSAVVMGRDVRNVFTPQQKQLQRLLLFLLLHLKCVLS